MYLSEYWIWSTGMLIIKIAKLFTKNINYYNSTLFFCYLINVQIHNVVGTSHLFTVWFDNVTNCRQSMSDSNLWLVSMKSLTYVMFYIFSYIKKIYRFIIIVTDFFYYTLLFFYTHKHIYKLALYVRSGTVTHFYCAMINHRWSTLWIIIRLKIYLFIFSTNS